MSGAQVYKPHGSSRNEAPYAWLWQDLKLADVSFEITFGAPQHLVVAALPSVDKATATASASPHRDSHSDAASSAVETNDVAAHPCSTKVYHLHSQVISSNSAFMRASLTSECGSAKRKRDSENDSFKWHLSARLEAQEAGVVEDVLRFFYTQELDNASTGLDLLMIMKVADLWQSSSLLSACSSKLVSLEARSFPVSAAYTLPLGLRSSASFSAVMLAAEVALLATFGNALEIIRSAVLLQSFLALPQLALLALLQSPKLATDAEASVLLLLSEWLGGPTGTTCPEEHVQELNSEIRYSRLSQPYLTGLSDRLLTPKLTREQLMELWEFSNLEKAMHPGHEHAYPVRHNPGHWYLSCRPTACQAETGVRVRLTVTDADLRRLLEGVGNSDFNSRVRSSPVYSEGFLWTLELAVDRGSLWIIITADGVNSVKSMDPVRVRYGIVREMNVQIDAATPLQLDEPAQVLVPPHKAGVLLTTTDAICRDSHRLDWWALYLVDGCVSLTASVQPLLS